MLPSRPRSHELDTESERAFKCLLPSSWIVRPQSGDYGIDAEVEIFEDDHTTGMTFKVQLKGTDTSRRRCTIKIGTLEYWRSLDVPVLVVLYESRTGQLYGRWAHTHDPHVHLPTRQRHLQSTTFRFADDDQLSQDAARKRLCEDVRRLRAVRSGLVEPLTYSIEFTDLPRAHRRHLAVRRLLDAAPLRTSPASADRAMLRIECGQTELEVAGPAGLAALTVHLDRDLTSQQHAAEIVAAMGYVLTTLGAQAHAINLFLGAGKTRLLRTFEVATAAGTCRSATGRHADAITLGGPFLHDPDPSVRDAGNLILATAITGNMVTRSVAEDLLQLDQELIEIEIAQDERRRAALAYKNFGEHLGSAGMYEFALAAYAACADYYPQYSNFDHYHRELGDLHRNLGQDEAAVSAYRNALKHGGDPLHIVPRLADSLMRSGRYQETTDLLAGWNSAGSPASALAGITKVVADLVVRTTGLRKQIRRDPVSNDDVPVSDPWLCRQHLIDIDALDPRYWLVAAETLPDEDELAYAVLIAYLSDDPRFWSSATCTAYRLGSPLVRDLAEQAYHRCGTSYPDVLAFLSESDDSGEPWFDLADEEIARLADDVCHHLATRPDNHPAPMLWLIPPTR